MHRAGRPPALARNIQRLRKRQHLSLDDLSSRSGVSKAMISQIEADKVNPTIATICKIAFGLGMELQELLLDERVGKFDIHRRSQAVILEYDEGKCSIQVIAPHGFAEDQEIYIVSLEPGGSLLSKPHFPGTEEIVTVMEGRVEIISGEHRAELGERDSAHYNADIAHSLKNAGDVPALAYMLVRLRRMSP